ncbi:MULTISPECIES: helix-turn-helix domain-containing protein [Corallococcus]|uniref:AlbA family DNA-binding domain-containing protein n=1 Tax=Corallococcus TaxID=83461 RepID=UPI0013159EB5|nr:MULTISPECIES: ATP-binding protein [Corallococcus]
MKKPWEWAEEDLLELINSQVQESLTLDYKASKALDRTEKVKDEITKDVSALANSAGGTLVYGIPENKQTRMAERIDEGVDPAVVTREWLDQVINSGIQRRIDGVRIQQIPLTKSSPGRVAYVVHVPQSVRAPHQARDKLFYKRFEYQSKPMEEYEIRDVSRRQEVPDLRVTFHLSLSGHSTPNRDIHPWHIILENKSSVPCHEAVIDLLFDGNFRLHDRGPLHVAHHELITSEKGTIQGAACRLFWSSKGGLPAFDACPVEVAERPIVISHKQLLDGRYLVKWKVSAPRTSPKDAWTAYNLFHKGTTTEFGFTDEDLSEEQAFELPGVRWSKNQLITTEWK